MIARIQISLTHNIRLVSFVLYLLQVARVQAMGMLLVAPDTLCYFDQDIIRHCLTCFPWHHDHNLAFSNYRHMSYRSQ